MAESTERPGSPPVPNPAPASWQAPPLAGDVPTMAPREPEPYRPLSILAILGFAVTAVFGAGLLLFGAVAMIRGVPLLWDSGVLIIPLGGAALSLAALIGIQRSEGTRAGGRLALWGMFLGLLTTLGYGAYLLAITLVIREQAVSFSRTWIEELAQGDTDKAFADTLLPERRPRLEGNELRRELESKFNDATEPTQGGPLSRFGQAEYVRFLRQGGPSTRIESIGVRDWKAQSGGYMAYLECRLVTDEGSCTLQISVFGSSRPNVPGREWNVAVAETRFLDGPTWTPKGALIPHLHDASRKAAQVWQGDLKNNPLAAYLDMRPAEERAGARERVRQLIIARVVAGIPSPGLPWLDTPPWYLPDYTNFARGDYLTADPAKDYWIADRAIRDDEQARAAHLDGVRRSILKGEFAFETTDAASSRRGDILTVEHNIYIPLPPNAMVEGALIVQADARPVDRNEAPKDWRVVGVKLFRSRSVMPAPGTRAPGVGPPSERPQPRP